MLQRLLMKRSAKRILVLSVLFLVIAFNLYSVLSQEPTPTEEGVPLTETPTELPPPVAIETQPPTAPPSEPPTSLPIPTETPTMTLTETLTATFTESATATMTETGMATAIGSPSETPTAGATETATVEITATETATPTPTLMPVQAAPQVELGLWRADDFNHDLYATNWSFGVHNLLAPSDNGWALRFNSDRDNARSRANDLYNVVVQARLLIATVSAQVSVRHNDFGSYRAVLSADGQVALYRGDVLVGSNNLGALDSEQWHVMQLSAIEGSVSVAVDEKAVITFQDSAPLPPGSVTVQGTGMEGNPLYADDVNFWVPTDELARRNAPPVDTAPQRAGGGYSLLATGSRIAFTSLRDGNAEIYLMSAADGSNVTRLTNNTGEDADPAWSPDGTRIAFVSSRDGDNEIYVMDADGSNLQQLTDNGNDDGQPAWSPDGFQIAFSSDREGNYEIFVMDADGSNPVNHTNNSAGDMSPTWSADGFYIAFQSWRDGNAEIYYMSTTGFFNTYRLTDNSAFDTYPYWSPDGSSIAFQSTRDAGYQQLYRMDGDGSNVTRLTTSSSYDETPAWAPDSAKLVFASSDGLSDYEIYVRQSGGSLTQLTDNDDEDGFPDWEPASETPTPTATPTLQDQLANFGVTTSGNWTTNELQAMLDGVTRTGQALQSQFGGASPQDAFRRVMYTPTETRIEFVRVATSGPYCETDNNPTQPAPPNDNLLAVVTCYDSSLQFTEYTAVHELGHVFEGRTGGYAAGSTYFGLMDQPPLQITTTPGTLVPDPVLRDNTGQIVMGNWMDPVTLAPDWVRGQRGWGSAASTPPAVPCNFQQNAYTINDWEVTATPAETQRAKERDEAAADMFLNWVYSETGQGGFRNDNYTGITDCTTTPTPDLTRRPGDARDNYMDNIVMPTLATYVPTPTATP